MSFADESSFSAEKFSGIARLFPLPNLVVFPHVMQPLHIFEPRYRALFEEAIADDRLIAMAILAPGWEANYEGRPPVRPHACLCKIATHHRTDEGNYNVLLLGVKRVEIVRELPPSKLFREAEVRLRHDDYGDESAGDRLVAQQNLLDLFKGAIPKLADSPEQLDQLLAKHIPLGMLTDMMGYTLDLGHERKEQLLAETNVDRRVELLFEYLSNREQDAVRASFPPDFSLN